MSLSFMKRIVFSIFVTATLLTFPFVSRAQVIKDEQEEERSGKWEIESSVKFEPRSSAKAQQGSVQIYRADSLIGYEFKAFGKLPIELSYYARETGLDNKVTDVHLPARLIENIFGLETTLPFFNFNKTYFRINLEPSYYSDRWDFPSSGFRMNSNYLLIYQPDHKWTFLGGIAFFPDTENPVLPVAGVIYKPSDKLTFYIAPPRPNITYKLTDKLSVFAEGSFAIDNEYEVKFDNTRRATLRYYETYVGGGIGYEVNKFISTSLSVGGNFRRRLTYDDSLGKVNLKDGMYTTFRVTVTP